jgi:hypothetical protein
VAEEGVSMTEHAGLIQVTTFRPVPGRRDEVLALCAGIQERAAAAGGCFGVQTCTVDGVWKPWWQFPGGAAGAAWRRSRLLREVAPRSGSAMC